MESIQETQAREDVLGKSSTHVYELFKEHLPEDVLYHSYEHTVEAAKAADRIGRSEGLDGEDLTVVLLAAWFHDVGYIEGPDDHERRSARLAREFLEDQGLTGGQLADVGRLILSTRPDHEPADLLEAILHDADVVHIGKRKKFFRYSERLRKEWEQREGRRFSEQEWTEIQLDFLTRTDFVTESAAKRWGGKRRRNVKVVQQRLAELLNASKALPKVAIDRKSPSRGIETMFRTAYRNHINLSQIADSKANIMISINAILMSIIVSFISTRLQEDAWLLIPAGIMLITSLTAIIFAILGARPNVTSRYFSLEDVRRNRANILFFGNFVNMSLDEFGDGMHEIMADWDRLYDSMINDLYSLGQVLQRKYRLLWLAYSSFMLGLILTVVTFFILYFGPGLN
jgi:predicted metal-dependent HD superfamily phosphohydrolase